MGEGSHLEKSMSMVSLALALVSAPANVLAIAPTIALPLLLCLSRV